MSLDNYQLLNPLEASTLYLRYCARDRRGNAVEVRVIREGLRKSSEWDSWVKRIRLATMLNHSAFQRLAESDLTHEPPFLVLEWLAGSTLVERHAKQPLSEQESFQLGARLADGLIAVHRLGLAHGLIAPGTIFSRAANDWAIDISTSPGSQAIATNGAYTAFAAPELSEAGTVELESDVFSLGAVLRWLLADQPLAAGADEWQSLLDQASAPDPTARPNAAQMAQHLNAIIALLGGYAGDRHVANRTTMLSPTGIARLDQTVALPSGTEHVSDRLLTGGQLGPYEILEKLGQGGMGAVYRARDLADGSIVAVKVLSESLAASAESRRRFAKEARMLARANNPYVANLLTFNADAGVSYLAVEFVPGGSLAQWLERHGRCDEATSLALVADAARGLSVAHERDIVHRDIKPANLLLTQAGMEFLDGPSTSQPVVGVPLMKLSDFGLARTELQSESLAITYDGTVLGTPHYMSPEQCRGAPADARSDVYSLGTTLFHLLVGKPPFEAATHVAVMNKHCHEPPPGLRKLRPELSDAVDRVVLKCLTKNPDARYLNAGELLRDLENLRCGSPTSIRLHPPLPASGGKDVLTFEFTWELNSSPAQLWPYVSNTDRLNQAMGLPSVRFSTHVDPQRGVRRFAEAAVAGQRLSWEEHPYEWIEGRRMSVLREFTQGPFRWFVNIVEMQPRAGGGTVLSQTVHVQPLGILGRWLAKLKIGRTAGKSLTRIYQQLDRYVASGGERDPTADAFRKPAELPAWRRSRLRQRLERLHEQHLDPQVLETLGQYLEHASDQEVARIRPLAFAERFRLDPSQVVAACLWGAREGLLVLLWDILCPSCRIPADVKETLAALQDHGYCEACNVDFELDFGNSVEVIFRAHPEIRDVETRTYCIGGPAFSSHVAAQTRLAPSERFEMDLTLSEGSYRVRGPQLPFVVELRVTPLGAVSRWDLPLSRPPARELIPLFKPHSQVITLTNDTPREVQVRLERVASRADALSAADASALALFREMFPGQVLAPGQMVSITSVTLLLAQVHEAAQLYRRLGDGPAFEAVRQVLGRVQAIVIQYGGAVVKTEGDGIVATFSDTEAALRSALELLTAPDRGSTAPPLQLALHRGPAMVTTLNDRLDYFGNSVHMARDMLAQAGGNELLLTDGVAGLSEMSALLSNGRIDVDVRPSLNGHTTEVVHRCRVRSRV